MTASDVYDLPFSEYVRDWQYAAMSVTPKTADKTIKEAVLRLCYLNNANTAYFDGISLIEEPAQTYKYDEKGNLESVKSSGNGEEDYRFNASNDLINVATEGSGSYEYEYKNASNKHLPTKVTNDTVAMNVSYDKYGRTTGTTLASTINTSYPKMASSTNYENGRLKNVTDNTGAMTSYGYDVKGRQNTVRNAAGTITTTEYEECWERPKSVYQSGVVSLGYTYTDGNLTRIARGGYLPDTTTNKKTQEYNLAYDSFGNMTSVTIGSSYRLAEYLYNAGNGTLKQMNYGGFGSVAKVEYAYDSLDRMVQAVYSDKNGSVTYGYQYSSDGNLAAVLENGELLHTYDYDTLGRLIHSSSVEDGKMVLYTDHQYDTSDRILSQTWQIGSDGFKERYEYNSTDGTLKTMVIGGDTLNFGYDHLNVIRQIILCLIHHIKIGRF